MADTPALRCRPRKVHRFIIRRALSRVDLKPRRPMLRNFIKVPIYVHR